MKMTNSIPHTFLLGNASTPPDWNAFRPTTREALNSAPRATGRFDIHDIEGQASEIICRVALGLCLVFAFVQCLVQIAAF